MANSISQPAPLTNWVNIPAVLVAGATAMQNLPLSLLVVVVTIASTHGASQNKQESDAVVRR